MINARITIPAVGGGSIAQRSGVKSSHTSFPGATAQTLAAAGAVSVGDLLVVLGGAGSDAGAIGVVDDSLGNTYTVLQAASGQLTMFIAYVISGFAGTPTVTVRKTTAAGWQFSFDAYTGATVTDRVDGGSAFGSVSPASDSVTSTATGSLILGAYSDETTNTDGITQTYGTLIGENEDGGATWRGSEIFAIESSIGTYTPTWTLATGGAWGVYTAAFKPA